MFNKKLKMRSVFYDIQYTLDINKYHIDKFSQVFINPAWLRVEMKAILDDPIFKKIRNIININFMQCEDGKQKYIFPNNDLKTDLKFLLLLYIYKNRFSIFLNSKDKIDINKIIPEIFKNYSPHYSYASYTDEFEGTFSDTFMNLFDDVFSENINTDFNHNYDQEELKENFPINSGKYPKFVLEEEIISFDNYPELKKIKVFQDSFNETFSRKEMEQEFLNPLLGAEIKVDNHTLRVLNNTANKIVSDFNEGENENEDNDKNKDEFINNLFIEAILSMKDLFLDHYYSLPGRERPNDN